MTFPPFIKARDLMAAGAVGGALLYRSRAW